MRRIVLFMMIWQLCLTAQGQISSELAYRRYTTQDGLPQMQAEKLWQDSRGYIYIGTLSGFVRYDGQSFTTFLKGRRENIVGFTETRSGVRALGFRRQWLIKGEDVSMQPISPDGKWLLNNFNSGDLPDGYVLLEDVQEQNRRLCRVTEEGFRPILTGAAFDKMTPDRRLCLDSLTGLHIPSGDLSAYHRSGQSLYAFGKDGIYLMKGRKAVRLKAYDWQAASFGLIVRSLKPANGRDSGPQLVIADEHSIYVFDGKEIRRMASGINLIKDMLVDRWGRLWVATYQGVYCFFGQNFVNHRLTDENDIVRAIGYSKGRLVMGSLNGKILVDGKIIAEDGSQFYAPSTATIGDSVYMAGNGDVVRISGQSAAWLGLPKDHNQFITQVGKRIVIGSRSRILAYDPLTGQSDTLSSEIPHPWCAAPDKEGRLWVGSSFGLYWIDSDHKTHKSDYPQNLVITTMEQTPQGDVLFASADSLFLIRSGEVTPQNVQLPLLASHEIRSLHTSPRGYLIVGVIDGMIVGRLNNDFQISDTQFFDHRNGLTMLEPQKATIAETDDGTIWVAGVEEMTSFKPEQLLAISPEDTYITPPLRWYEHPWVWVAGFLIIAAFIWLLARQYETLRHQREMQKLKRERKMKDLQIRAIRLKAIPHFHANVLAAIEYFMSNAPEEACKYLKLYSEFTNETLQDIDKPARTVEEETEYINNYLALQKLRYGDRLQYHVIVADNVDRQALLPTMLLHTYCENAIKHGLSPKPEGGTVNVIITSNPDETVVTVEDDGIGRRAAAKLSKNSTKQGLRILNEQIQLMNKANVHRIREHVTNIKNDQGKIAGTRFMLTIPKDFIFN